MLNNRYYELSELPEDLFNNIDFLFVGICRESRTFKIPELVKKKFEGKIITLEYDMEMEKYLMHDNLQIMSKSSDVASIGKDLFPFFINDLSELGLEGKNILIESTSLVHPLLFYFLKTLKKDFTLNNLFVTYTEPEKYKQDDEGVVNRRFDLTEKFCNRSSLPGFLRISNQEKDKTLVAIMGFEGNRFSKTYEEVNPAVYKTHAIVGFPSYQPSWQYYVYSQNQEVLEQSKAYDNIDRVSAYEPFGIYNVLKRIVENETNNEIIIAPLGTKPHSIGACMFAIDHEFVQLHYDYPFFGKKIRTEGVGKSYLYNLSIFINE